MKVARTTFPHAPTTAPTVAVVLLAGGMRHSPLRQQLGVPSLCLPLSHDRTLLDHWLSTAEVLPQCRSVVIAVSGAEDAETIRKAVAARNRSIDVQVVIEPATWRGPAGLLYDLVQGGRCGEPGEAGRVVVAGEASCLPPDDLEALIECLNRTSPGVSVTSRSGQPAGLYALSDQALQMIPSIGFYDIKEQLLPAR